MPSPRDDFFADVRDFADRALDYGHISPTDHLRLRRSLHGIEHANDPPPDDDAPRDVTH